MAAGSIVIDLLLKSGSFETDTKRAEKNLASFKKQAQSTAKGIKDSFAGNLLASAVEQMAKSVVQIPMAVIDSIDSLNDLSAKTSLSVEQLDALSLAATLSGTNLESLGKSISKLSENMGKDSDKFRKLGISAQDPIEAFKQLSDLFVSLKDPQTQAALGAATLGDQWQTVAPLLANGSTEIARLIDKGMELSGVTNESAENAGKFNDELDILRFRAKAASQEIAGPLLSSLNDVISSFNNARNAGRGFFDALGLGLSGQNGLDSVVATDQKNLAASLKAYGSDSEQYFRELRTLQANLQRQADALGAQPFTMPNVGNSPVDSGTVKKLLDHGKTGSKGATGLSESQRYLKSLQGQLDAVNELSVAEQSLQLIQSGRLGVVTEAQRALIEQTANQIDVQKLLDDQQSKASASMQKDLDEIAALYDSTRTPLEKYNAQVERLNDLMGSGLDWDTYSRGIQQAQESFDALSKSTDDFAKRAAENIQDSIGEGLVNILDGDFKDIGKNFGNMVKQIAAEAVAADIARSLFGDLVKGGKGSGVFGGLLSTVGSFLGGKAGGGDVMKNNSYLVGEQGPELFVPRTMGSIMTAKETAALSSDTVTNKTDNATAISYAPVIHIDSRTDRAQILADVKRINDQGNAQLVDRLQRAGRL